MPRYSNLFFLTIISLLSLASVQAAFVRIDDYVTLNGTALQFDPIEGLNDTTRDPTWQMNYFHSLDLLALNEIYQKANQNGTIVQRQLVARNGATCLACMVVKLASKAADTRTDAYDLCTDACSTIALSTIKKKVQSYWLLAGIGAYAAGNYAYDVWVSYGWS